VLEPALRRAAAGRPELGLALEVPAGLVAGVDAAVLERMVVPVLENAVRHATREVRVEGSRRNGTVRLLIGDDGPGIPAEHRERVFEPGWRGDGDDGHEGAGLGLALTRRLATAAGASVCVVPAAVGACFAVDLPAG
jgi:signal transduction histidine kinase